MKRYVVAAVLLLLASCRQPPEYESHYAPPSSSSSQPQASETPTPAVRTPTPLTKASFVDDFDRPDTDLGLGEGWDMRSRDIHFDPDANKLPLPAATDGFIRDGRFTYAGDSIVYAVRQFRGTVQRIGSLGRWRQSGDGSETTLAMAISANDLIVADMVHFTANRSTWKLTVRQAAGNFEPVAEGHFSPTLALDRDYVFELEATGITLTVRVPGATVTRNVLTTGLLGDRAFWQEYPNGAPSGVVFDFNAVWAAEDGQPLQPVER